MDNTIAIKVDQLHRYYGDLHAVQGISLEINQGAIFSLLGPNGAGKSTTISVIAGLLKPSQGNVDIMGHPVTTQAQQAKRFIGVVPQEIALYDDLTGRENLLFWGRMYDLAVFAIVFTSRLYYYMKIEREKPYAFSIISH